MRSRAGRRHIRCEIYTWQALCGQRWPGANGGRVASSLDIYPPLVKNDETGTAHFATCARCLLRWRQLVALRH